MLNFNKRQTYFQRHMINLNDYLIYILYGTLKIENEINININIKHLNNQHK